MAAVLPSVPNVAGLLHWACGRGQAEAPALLVAPPDRLLPALSDLDDAERLERLQYWGSVNLLSPLLMAVICESLRLTFRVAKLRLYPSFKPVPQEDVELRALSMAPGSPVEEKLEIGGFLGGVAAYHVLCGGLVVLAVSNSWISSHAGGGVAWELWAIWQQLCLWTLFVQNLLRCCMMDAEALGASTWKAVLLYTVPCISDLFDTMKDWLITGICLLEPRTSWGFPIGAILVSLEVSLLLAGRLPRCIPLKEEISLSLPLLPLQVLFALASLSLAAGPGCVRLWATLYANLRYGLYSFVVLPATVLLYALRSLAALFLLALQWLACVVAFLGMAIVDIPVLVVSIFDSSLIRSSVSAQRKCLNTYCSMAWYQPGEWFNQTNTSVHSKSLTVTDVDSMSQEQSQDMEGWMHGVYLYLADGGLLCIFSLYVVIYSYLQVLAHEDGKRDLQRSFGPILELRRPPRPVAERCTEWSARTAGNLSVDFLSSSRLMMAWTRDWPQVVIGLVLVWRYNLQHHHDGFGLAGISTIISLCKGLLIPSFQACLCQWQENRALDALEVLISWERLPALARKLHQTFSRIRRPEVEQKLQTLVEKQSLEVLQRFNVTERSLFRPVVSAVEQWMSDCLPLESDQVQEVTVHLLAIYVDKGATAEELSAAGYPTLEVLSAWRLLGRSCSSCRDEGLVTTTAMWELPKFRGWKQQE
eukprot:s5300_g4.t1